MSSTLLRFQNTFWVWFSLSIFINLISSSRQLFSATTKKALHKHTVHYLLSTRQHTDTVRDQLVNKVGDLAAIMNQTLFMSWWRPKTELEGCCSNIHHRDTNLWWLCRSVSVGCINVCEQISHNNFVRQ